MRNFDTSIFVFTNGRSTFKYCYRSIEQSVEVSAGTVKVIRNQSLAPAMNSCLDSCNTPFFLKVDDDFFLHPQAIKFMRQQLLLLPEGGWTVYCCALWDVFRSALLGNMKIYNVEVVKSIGGFFPDDRGRVDGGIISRSKTAGLQIIHDHKSVVGLHVCGSKEDQELHRNLWKGHVKVAPEQAEVFYQMTSMRILFRKRISKLNKLNDAKQSSFYKWLSSLEGN